MLKDYHSLNNFIFIKSEDFKNIYKIKITLYQKFSEKWKFRIEAKENFSDRFWDVLEILIIDTNIRRQPIKIKEISEWKFQPIRRPQKVIW